METYTGDTMDIFILLLFMIVVVLMVIVIQLRRKCVCLSKAWKSDFDKWVTATDQWKQEVQDYLDAFNTCLNEKCAASGGGTNPPRPPPCNFGDC